MSSSYNVEDEYVWFLYDTFIQLDEQPGRYTVLIRCVFSSSMFRVGGLISWSHLLFLISK